MGDGVLYRVFGTDYYSATILSAREKGSVYSDSNCGIDFGCFALYQKVVLDCICACFQQRVDAF